MRIMKLHRLTAITALAAVLLAAALAPTGTAFPQDGGSAVELPEDRLDILDLDNWDDALVSERFVAFTSEGGQISAELDPEITLGAFSQSLKISSDVPCGDVRYAQLDYRYTQPQDFTGYSTLSFWVYAPEGTRGEVSISLLEFSSEEWMSSRWFEGNGAWQRFDVALAAGSLWYDNPWSYPNSLAVPNWFASPTGRNPDFQLDVSEIFALRFRALTVDSQCAADSAGPAMEAWFGAMYLSNEPVEFLNVVELPVIDTFDYGSAEELNGYWRVNTSGEAYLDVNRVVALDPPSLQIDAIVPCAPSGRYMTVERRFPEPLDLTGYETITVIARGDGITEPPHGGELSVILWDSAGEEEEMWQSVNWLQRNAGWVTITIRLHGDIPDLNDTEDRNPWNHREDFTVPHWEHLDNAVFDLDQITRIGIRANNTDNVCDYYPTSMVWVDEIRLD